MHRHNLILLAAMPALAAACAWALFSFYLEGGAGIPVGILDFDRTEFSETAVLRFTENASLNTRELDAAAPDFVGVADPESDFYRAAVARAERLVQRRSLEAVVVVLPGFAEKMRAGEPEGSFDIICQPTGVARGLVAELFAAQTSRLGFGCDAANRVLRERVAAARSARRPAPTEEEQAAIWDEAFRFYDAYWEPEPLMTVDYRRWPAAGAETDADMEDNGGDGDGSAATGWRDIRGMLNDLIARAVFAMLLAYSAFCALNATGVAVSERESGIRARLRSCGTRMGLWTGLSAAASFLLYGVPGAALLYAVTRDAHKALFALTGLLCLSLLGALVAQTVKRHGHYRAFTLPLVLLSLGAALVLY